MKLRFLWHSKVLLLSTVSLNTFYFDTLCNFWKKESVSLKEGCNEKKNTKGVSPLTMTDSPIRKTFTGNVSSTYNFCFSSDRNLPHALGLGEEWHLNCWVRGFPRIVRFRIFHFCRRLFLSQFKVLHIFALRNCFRCLHFQATFHLASSISQE